MASFTQADLFREAGVVLFDPRFTRWTLAELNQALNAGIRVIATEKPNSVSRDATLALVAGTEQALTDPDFALIRAKANLTGPAITEVGREIMDVACPDWANPAVYPATQQVQHILFDPAEPAEFRVFPANDGSGSILAVVATMPTSLPDGASPTDVTTFSATVPLPDTYRQALLDYVLFKAFSKDNAQAAAAGRAQGHYAAFASAIGIKFRNEVAASPKTTNTAVDAGV